MKKIPMYVESKNGHDTFEIPEDEVQDEVEDELEQDKWVTLENEDGSTEILTQKDIPQAPEHEWAEKFRCVKSVTATNKAKGG